MLTDYKSLAKFLLSPAFTIDRMIEKSVKKQIDKSLLTLDFGCGECLMAQNYDVDRNYIGLDIEDRRSNGKSHLRHIQYDGDKIPLEPNSIEQVISLEVFEHIENLDHTISQLKTILIPGGKMVISVPFMWVEHEQPNDFRRFTAVGLAAKMEKHGFKIVSVEKLGPAAVLTLLIVTLRSELRRVLGKHISYLVLFPLVVLSNIRNLLPVKKNANSYLNTVIVVENDK